MIPYASAVTGHSPGRVDVLAEGAAQQLLDVGDHGARRVRTWLCAWTSAWLPGEPARVLAGHGRAADAAPGSWQDSSSPSGLRLAFDGQGQLPNDCFSHRYAAFAPKLHMRICPHLGRRVDRVSDDDYRNARISAEA